ncbi:MAG TPA: 2-succinyl-5-enolpyruvyl-6-hydroxy-3-cyclohexene-1-carboxylic-acid synthase [Acidimicrobiales bacterium]|nr:2-succinyl-5-enolpyruvyl-6-hydroxy-3-cyclohexene-1-carboxylic-acid synthase [Acidimicrobiales bacterium]
MSVLQATFCATLVDEWVRAGVRDAVVCPGSRSTPLALALLGNEGLRVHVLLDERGAGFFAVGLANASGRPVVLCVTSGTAAAELHAAVVEAHHARVPLIVCTADRPPELHGVGAGQTIEQRAIYGDALRWSSEPGVPVEETTWSWRSLGARAAAEAQSGPMGPGPVHLNLAFREPLVGAPGPLPEGRPDGEPVHQVVADRGVVTGWDWPAEAGVLVAGAGCGSPDKVLALAEHLGWPVLPDPRSGCRRSHDHVVAAADAIARCTPATLSPAAVVRLGAPWASKALPAFLAGAEALAVDPFWRWDDPDRQVGLVHRADPDAWLDAALETTAPRAPAGWLECWQDAERVAQKALDDALGEEMLSEPGVARRLVRALPDSATVVVSSSMPVRDLEWFAPPRPSPPRVLANRGANGIDGVCSTALGAAAGSGGPVVALVGDLAFFHDLSALVSAAGRAGGASCTIVVVDNNGGGIFEFLPQRDVLDPSTFERLFATPQQPDVLRVAAGFGLDTADAGTPCELDEALRAATVRPGVSIVRARVPSRSENVSTHDRAHAAVAAALSDIGL